MADLQKAFVNTAFLIHTVSDVLYVIYSLSEILLAVDTGVLRMSEFKSALVAKLDRSKARRKEQFLLKTFAFKNL